MSVNELQALAQQFADAFDRRDLKPAIEMLSEDVEVFEYVPYRFDGKQMYGDTVGIVNAYGSFRGVTKDGKVLALYDRGTLVFVKHGGRWKIVSAHFSAMPQGL